MDIQHWEAIQLNSKPYMSVSLRIEIPYIEAKNNELLDNENHIIIDKFLQNKDWIKKYCLISGIRRGETKYVK